CIRTGTGSVTARDCGVSCVGDAPDMAFRLPPRRRRPGGAFFRGCIPGLPVPLSTLRGRPRMTRGRRGPLTLHRTTLSFATPRRFSPAHGGIDMNATRVAIATSLALAWLGPTAPAEAQQNAMTFFITSVGSGKGADLGGL